MPDIIGVGIGVDIAIESRPIPSNRYIESDCDPDSDADSEVFYGAWISGIASIVTRSGDPERASNPAESSARSAYQRPNQSSLQHLLAPQAAAH